jgi:hypothetical protein
VLELFLQLFFLVELFLKKNNSSLELVEMFQKLMKLFL